MTHPADATTPPALDHCGGCAGLTVDTPLEVNNRPGLNAIAYRIGTHARFKRSMLARLSATQASAALRRLNTREDDDVSIALLDAWATVADVLTFYQERIANESYLRTATELRSVRELARLIGYEPRPGVAASTWLAFTIDDAPGSPAEVNIPAGTQAQSVPGPGETPQIFETVEEIKARSEWNALRPLRSVPWDPKEGDGKGWFAGTGTNLRPGDTVLLVREDEANKGLWLWDALPVLRFNPDHDANRTEVEWSAKLHWWEGGLAWPVNAAEHSQARERALNAPCKAFAFRDKAAIFGNNASEWRPLSESVKSDYLGHGPRGWEVNEWPAFEIFAPPDPGTTSVPRLRHVPPKPQEIADAANGAAEGIAKATQLEVQAAIAQAAQRAVSALQAIVDVAAAVGGAFATAWNASDAADIGQQFESARDQIRDNLVGKKNIPDDRGALQSIGLQHPGIEQKASELLEAFGKLGPNLVAAFSRIANNALDATTLNSHDSALEDKIKESLESIPALVLNSPEFRAVLTLIKFVEELMQGGDTRKELRAVLTSAKLSLASGAEIVGATTGAGVSRVVTQILTLTMKQALRPPPSILDLNLPTPDSVALVARMTVKIAKWAALFAALPMLAVDDILHPTSPDALGTKLHDQLTNFRNVLRLVETDISGNPVALLSKVWEVLGSGQTLPAAFVSALPTALPSICQAEFDDVDNEDRMAIAIVVTAGLLGLGTASVALATGPGAFVVGAGILATAFTALGLTQPAIGILSAAALTALSIGLAVVISAAGLGGFVIAMTLVAIAAATGASLASILGPLLLKYTKQMELAVVNAVEVALFGPEVTLPARDPKSIGLDAVHARIVPTSWAVLSVPGHRRLFQVEAADDMTRAEFMLSLRATRLKMLGSGLVGPFELSEADLLELVDRGLPSEVQDALREGQPFVDEERMLAAARNAVPYGDNTKLRKTFWLEQDMLKRANKNKFSNAVREVSVLLQSESLILGNKPIRGTLEGGTIALEHDASDLKPGRKLVVNGRRVGSGADAEPELVELDRAESKSNDGAPPVLVLKRPLTHTYELASATLNANVASANHGETIHEVLGSGDSGQPYQTFALKQSPLTHVSAAGETGESSTLKVWVNDLEWHERPALYGCGPKDRIYTTRTDEDGKTHLRFGDGRLGARVPTGQENVRATYRKGIGLDGLVRAGQLSLLVSRSLGLKDVTNPFDAGDAANAESLADVRRNAPIPVLAMGRVVSLRDYEDFARAFAGVAKALATWSWDGGRRCVFVTLAGSGGAAILPDGDLCKNLLAAMKGAGDPNIMLRVGSYRPTTFRIAGTVRVEDDFIADVVVKDVERSLRAAFSFDARDFGQPVTLVEALAAMHRVPGVRAVENTVLYRTGWVAVQNTRLLADMPVLQPDGEMAAAELLTLDLAPRGLEVAT